MGIARGPTPQDDMNRNLPKDTNRNRYNKPAQTPVGGAEMAKPAFNRQTQREMTTAAEVGRKLSDLTEPSLYQGSAVETEGAVTRSGTDGSSTACPVYLPDAVYINKTLITRACVVHDFQEIGAMASHESENLTENPKQPVVEPIRHIH